MKQFTLVLNEEQKDALEGIVCGVYHNIEEKHNLIQALLKVDERLSKHGKTRVVDKEPHVKESIEFLNTKFNIVSQLHEQLHMLEDKPSSNLSAKASNTTANNTFNDSVINNIIINNDKSVLRDATRFLQRYKDTIIAIHKNLNTNPDVDHISAVIVDINDIIERK